ncbi:hypothetical protein ARAM_004396 [Aspergillus rambellii]|uniref:Rab-GAP TBC domain-containing protein n=2 Tax=Aspergillus subgen. Nidulantes TaxID=2720870 RepID=A0A0F8X613_9EURO|nr:hypothetical protein ARAM_004396 [Aspergillus rambellii]KKK24853.1 hypothetical protein AOCH_002372 [Aspergillus ochraceoroseus]
MEDPVSRESHVIGPSKSDSAFLLFEDLDRAEWSNKISESRSAYVALQDHFLKYIEHPDDLQSTLDPLADDEESPWQHLRNDEQMRADISQDVDRCLQENFFFREPATKAKMINTLFIYSKLNPDLGYRQGMHELLAPILWVTDRDAIDPQSFEQFRSTGQEDDLMIQLLNPNYIEHDSFTLFCVVMQNTRMYYEHNRSRSTDGQMDAIPIVHQCEYIHNNLLAATDQQLADHLQAIDILPQIFLTRWMRLLFGREFPFQDVLVVWDLLFAEGLRPELVDFVCVAMLLRVRWQLLSADSSGALSTLLRYPSPEPHAPVSFVQDGLYLEQNPTPDRGAFIISKYSGKPPDSPKPAEIASGKLLSGKRFQFRNDLKDRSDASSPSRSPARNSPLSIEGLLQDVSEGIQRRTESWGVAKAVRGAVSEAKKNMQAIQSEHNARAMRFADSATMQTSETLLYRDSEVVNHLKSQIQRLEERNLQLAKTLGQAVNDIRSQVEKKEAPDPEAIRTALMEIQTVQTSLETPPANENPKAAESDGPSRSSTDSSGTSQSTCKSPVQVEPRNLLFP